ncbi:MAG: ferredoxin--NADP reductase [Planctomycetota bacterium]|nr:MAG: ferredoxin--NADP reductase [Planctomycetota bacterium]
MPEDICNATITQIDPVNDYLVVFHVAPDSGRVPDFEPGQFTTLGLPREEEEPGGARVGKDGKRRIRMIKRAYSIASSSDVKDHMEFCIILVEDGQLTPRMWKLDVGRRVWMSDKISGEFTLDPVPPGKDLVLVSTGTGIAPYISMYRRYRHANRWRRAVIINGVRHARDLAYREELETYAREDPNFTYIPVVSRDDDWPGVRGRVPATLEAETYLKLVGAPLDPGQCHVYLCGNPQMIDDVEAMLLKRGFKTHKKREPGNIHLERYW